MPEKNMLTASGEPSTSKKHFIEICAIHKRFAGVHALRGISLNIYQRQIYHLIGENGCGKSTLIKIISGVQPPDEGALVIDGNIYTALTPIEALSAGIETVYQDLSLLPNLSVAENIALTQQVVASGGRLARRLDHKKMKQTAAQALTKVGLPNDAGFMAQRVDELPIARRQLISIARAIVAKAKLVIMDEPTTALTRREVNNLIEVVGKLCASGSAVLFVTHKLDECKEIGGNIIILRDGEKVIEGNIDDFDKAQLSFLMTGRRLDEARYRSASPGVAPLLHVEKLGRKESFENISFTVQRGEILGITGLLDSGRNELARVLAGVISVDAGSIVLDGKPLHLRHPSDASEAGIAYLPEDRLSEGLFLEKSIQENIAVSVLNRLLGKLGLIDFGRSLSLTDRFVEELQIATPDTTHPVQTLSGGNQQRVLLGRCLAIEPKLLVLHGPTVGVDVGSKDTIYRIIQSLTASGLGVIIISDDLRELLQNCDRILVMRKGLLAGTYCAENLSEQTLYEALASEQEVEAQT